MNKRAKPAHAADSSLEAASGTGVYEWRPAEDWLVWSPGLLRIYGLSETPQGEGGFSCLVHPEDRVRVEAETAGYLSSDVLSYSHAFRIVRPDGSIRFVLDRGMVERDAKGRALVIRGLNVDLTDAPACGPSADLVDEKVVQRISELEALYAEAPLGLAMLDRELRFVRINSALAEINGYSVEQHLGRRAWDLLPDLRTSAEAPLQQVLETGLPLRDVPVKGETAAQPGVVREWREHFYPLRGSDGTVQGIGIVCEEVTERLASERALAESEARLVAALQSGRLGVHEYDPRTGSIKWDAAVRSIWGVSADEPITYDTFVAGLHPDDAVPTHAAVQAALNPDGSGRYEAVYRVIHRPTKEVRWVRADGDATFDGRKAARLVGTAKDITERMRVDAARRESEERFRTMADGVPVMVWVTEPDGSCSYLNKYWYDFTGQTAEEALGFGWLKAVHPDDAAESERIFRAANARHEEFRLDYRLRRADGVYRWAIDSARPRLGPNGEFLGFIGSVIDISDRKEAEALKAFGLRLSDALRPLSRPTELQEEAARVLGEELHASRVAYYEIDAEHYVVKADYARGAPSIVGSHPLAWFSRDLLDRHRRSEPIVVADVKKAHSETETRRFGAIDVGAYIGVPFVKNGQFIAGITVHSTMPRNWTAAEVAIAVEAAERTWAAVERARAEERRRESEARYRTLFDAIDEGFCVTEVRFAGPDGRVDYRVIEANPAFYQRTGFPEAILGRWLREAAPQLEEHWYERYGRVARTGEPARFEQHSDMLGRWFDVYAFQVGAPQDRRVGILFNDISTRKRHEEQTQLLMREVNHRAKNMLALVDAVAKQTASVGPKDFIERFSERVRALAASQDLLVQTDWSGADLASLIKSQLLHFVDLVGSRITLSGVAVEVVPRSAQTLGMALHELATNAAKYGALSNDRGRIDISWNIIERADGPHFSISWKETMGPRVVAPTRSGFGGRVAKTMVEAALQGEVALEFAEAGLVWSLRCLLSAVGAAKESPVQTVAADIGANRQKAARNGVLIVEDDAILAMDLAESLRKAGHDIIGPVGSVAQAMALLQHSRPSLAILDVNLGRETSEPIADWLRAHGIPFVGVSGYSHMQRPQIFEEAPYFSKPLHLPSLLQALSRVTIRE